MFEPITNFPGLIRTNSIHTPLNSTEISGDGAAAGVAAQWQALAVTVATAIQAAARTELSPAKRSKMDSTTTKTGIPAASGVRLGGVM
jgi:hypothetical protein